MRESLARKVIRSIKKFSGNSATFHIRKLRRREWKKINFQFLKPEHDVLAVFCVGDDSIEYWFVFVNHRLGNPDNYYLVIHSRPAGRRHFVVEIHTVSEGNFAWTYHPRAQDDHNPIREERFIELYGSTEVTIPLPIGEVAVDEFLSDVFYVMDTRETAHDVDVAISAGRGEAFPEGKHVEKMHKFRERSSRAVREAKRRYAEQNGGRLPCEVCGFDFAEIYDNRGIAYIEAHHRVPLSDLDGQRGVETKPGDLAMVCANCHRMLHRSPWLTVEELREQVICSETVIT